nr:hypothetical protein [Tanacetum cinerariifolium]
MSVRELLLQKLHKALQAVCEKLNQQEHAANSTIPLNEITYQIPLPIAIIPVLPIKDPEDSLIMGDEDLSTILEKESDKVIKYSVENLLSMQLLSYDDFSPIKVSEGKYVTFSNPLFDSNYNFTSSDDESLSDEDVLEDNVKIYSNPLFVFDDDYISSDVNPFFDKVLEDIESKVSYDSNLDDPTLLLIPFFDSNEDEYSAPGDDIELLLHHDQSTPKMRVVSILEGSPRNHLSNRMMIYLIWNLKRMNGRRFCTMLQLMIWITLDYEDSRARGFVHHLLELRSLAYGNSIF